jgi:hypothetical protein
MIATAAIIAALTAIRVPELRLNMLFSSARGL